MPKVNSGGAITASKVIQLLAQKHHEDVFVAECKFGPTMYAAPGEGGRFDAWAMPRSWKNWTTVGYEVKVSRGDFLRDKKWRGYLPSCHEFYFVAPKGVISVEELATEPVGLLEVASTGNRLLTRKKAPRREDGVDAQAVMIYILMSRARIGGEYDFKTSNADQWRQWLDVQEEERTLGREVSKRMGEALLMREQKIKNREDQLKYDRRDIESALGTLAEWGLIPGETPPEKAISVLCERLGFERRTQWAIEQVERSVAGLKQVLDSAKAPPSAR
jgi:hypothetical protein